MAAVAYSDLPAGVPVKVYKDPTTGWPAGYTTRADIPHEWIGPAPAPTISSTRSGAGVALNNVDEWKNRPFPTS